MPREFVNYPFRTLRCDCCEADTTHKLNGREYVCEMCGNVISYFINRAKEGYAIELRESIEAQQRFENWILEVMSNA